MRNNCFFDPEEIPGQGGENPPKVDPPKDDKKNLKRVVIDGETIELTEEQTERAIALGVQKAKELAEQKEKESKKTEETKPVATDDINKKTQERLDKLEQDLAEAKDRERVALLQGRIEGALSKSGLDEDFREDVQNTIINKYSLAMKQGITPDLTQICQDSIDKFKKKLEKYEPKVNLEKKKEDREKTKSLASGSKPTAQEDLPKLNRNSFRDGSLRKRIGDRLKGMLE